MKKLLLIISFFFNIGTVLAQDIWKVEKVEKTSIRFFNDNGFIVKVSTQNLSIDFSLLRQHRFYCSQYELKMDILRYGIARIIRQELASPQEIEAERWAKNNHYGRWQKNYLQRVKAKIRHLQRRKVEETSSSLKGTKKNKIDQPDSNKTQTPDSTNNKIDTNSGVHNAVTPNVQTSNSQTEDTNHITVLGVRVRIDATNMLLALLTLIVACLCGYLPFYVSKKAERSKRTFNIVIVGDNGVGKSSLNLILKRSDATQQDVSQISTQAGIIQEALKDRVELRNKIEFTAITTQISFADENFRKRSLINEADILIFVVACCSRQARYSIDQPFINSQLQELTRHLGMISKKSSAKIIGLYVNKSDIVNRQNGDLSYLFNDHIVRCENKANQIGAISHHWYRSCLTIHRNVNVFSELLDILEMNKRL